MSWWIGLKMMDEDMWRERMPLFMRDLDDQSESWGV